MTVRRGPYPSTLGFLITGIVASLIGIQVVSAVIGAAFNGSGNSGSEVSPAFKEGAQATAEQLPEIAAFVFGGVVLISTLPVFAKAAKWAVHRILEAREYSVWTVGRVREISREPVKFPETTPCVNCGQTHYSGQRTDLSTRLVVFGIPVRTLESGEVIECDTCADADVVDYGLRADAHDDRVPEQEVAG
jgi:hypothetical protein